MANSKFEYVRNFEQTDSLLPNTWIVVRIDGRAFTKMCAKYGFEKPNDRRALDLMNAAAKAVVIDLPETVIAYGVSDEYSFVFHKSCNLFERRASKLVSTIVSTFTANYVYSWGTYFPDTPLSFPLPTFDGRAVCYPSVQNLRDYLSWRQVDCHINNLYNTTFWLLIQLGGLDNKEAERTLAGTLAADKNEILFSRFNINYNNEPEIFKKGSVIFRDYELVDAEPHAVALEMDDLAEPVQQSKSQAERDRKKRAKARVVVSHTDIIKDEFWNRRPWILSNKPGQAPKNS
ncbi:Glucose-responsive transcription factor [Claviceps sp. LM220 group G6]|nr:Glucose-responsive transcription factor [Claviceps sp. LM218 group G6]KAG6099287.1 Glucose-responsive transcription factor [Claviceps sp. LM220 group G6]KAG6103808.1 Glucose-responsive transcription factor [Claviceps sp. LM219 group G6]KAG6108640.1 Glucose-responsive transcription factor [Claviceps sp. LM454 group G7]